MKYFLVCVYVCMYVYIYIYIYTHTHTHTGTYFIIYNDLYKYNEIYIRICKFIFNKWYNDKLTELYVAGTKLRAL